MKKNLFMVLVMGLGMMMYISTWITTASAEEITRSVSTPNVDASGTVSNTATATTGATVIREPGQITISGIASSVGVVDTRTVQGSASGTLRIRWSGRGLEREPVSPPGAPELNGFMMFGVGFMVLGFGLLRARKRLC